MDEAQSKLWYEVRAIMDEADEHERALSSDDDDYAERVFSGISAPSSLHLRLDPQEPDFPRSQLPTRTPSNQFHTRRNAAFDGLDRNVCASATGGEDIGPAFSRQAVGFGLSELSPLPLVFGGPNWGSSADAAHESARGEKMAGEWERKGCEEEGEEEEDDGWYAGDPEDFGSGAEGSEDSLDDCAEWSSKTASWATRHGGSEEESEEEESEPMCRRATGGHSAPSSDGPRPPKAPERFFGGIADLEDLDDREGDGVYEMDMDEAHGKKAAPPACKRSGMDGPAARASSNEGKRVRFEQGSLPDEEGARSRENLAAGLLDRRRQISLDLEGTGGDLDEMQIVDAGGGGPQYVHYSLDNVPSDEGTNQAALAQLLSITRQTETASLGTPTNVMPEFVVGAPRRGDRSMGPPPPRAARAGATSKVQLSHLEQIDQVSSEPASTAARTSSPEASFRASSGARPRRNFRNKSVDQPADVDMSAQATTDVQALD
ncbi:MAG: hypothetical protein SGPRY_009186 [Prymnesium sp.]